MSSRAQIVASIGPASGTEETIKKMIASSMDIARINFSHGTLESNGGYIEAIRRAAKAAGKRIPIIMDLPGPRIQTTKGHTYDASQEHVVTARDLEILDFGIAKSVDYIAQSYVGSPDDVRVMRKEIQERGAAIPVIVKIERKEAMDAFDEILEEADGIMIARGDLGLSIPLEDIPFVERDLIIRTRAAGKPVITATEMLYSMMENDRPTRAEVTDIAYAIMFGSDAVMLSDETARGKHPVEAVQMMDKIVARAERDNPNITICPII